jgi:CBS domain-containing protein
MNKKLSVGHPDECLYDALATMIKNNIRHLPIVDRHYPDKLVGFLSIPHIILSVDLQKKTILGEK